MLLVEIQHYKAMVLLQMEQVFMEKSMEILQSVGVLLQQLQEQFHMLAQILHGVNLRAMESSVIENFL